jgi:hypothetical protein
LQVMSLEAVLLRYAVSTAELLMLSGPLAVTAVTTYGKGVVLVLVARVWDVGATVIDETLMNAGAGAVLVTLCEPTEMVVVPIVSPCSVALPQGSVAQLPVMAATEGSLLDQDTPLVRYMPWLLLLTP